MSRSKKILDLALIEVKEIRSTSEQIEERCLTKPSRPRPTRETSLQNEYISNDDAASDEDSSLGDLFEYNASSDEYIPNYNDCSSEDDEALSSPDIIPGTPKPLHGKRFSLNVSSRSFEKAPITPNANTQFSDAAEIDKNGTRSFETSDEESNGPLPKKPKYSRKKGRNKNQWKKVAAAKAREKGERYVSQKGIIMESKGVNDGNLCSDKCKLKCSDRFDLEQRNKILNDFYQLDVNGKNAILFKSITKFTPKRQRKGATKHKTASYKYNISINGENKEVCKSALLSLYQVGRKKVAVIQNKIKPGVSAPDKDKRGKHSNRQKKINDDVKDFIISHIKSFPAEPSHYSRNNNPNRLYLSPLLTVPKMHKLYLEKCRNDVVPEIFLVKESMYRSIFIKEFSLSFSHPKSDTCSTCDSGKCTEEHVEMSQAAYEAQKSDKESAKSDAKTTFVTMDLQQTMPLPRLTVSKAFYKRQMWFYNLGIHLLSANVDRALFCNWTEDIASRGSVEIASSLLTAIELDPKLRETDHLMIRTDSCSGQNKNFQIVCLYQYLIYKGYLKVIDHKFPEVGHSYLDSDRDFGRIEKNLRRQTNLYLPQEYRQIILESTRGNQVVDMQRHFRRMEEIAANLQLVNRKKDLLGETVHFRDGVKWIRVEEFGSYMFKESYDPNTPFRLSKVVDDD